jgi:Family of unknown function (DUF6461)
VGDVPDFDGWLARMGLGGLAEAACLTFVSGSGDEAILAAFGVDLDHPARTLREALDGTSACVGVLAWGDGFVAIELNGGEGIRPEVLRDLSRTGVAAGLFWNVNAMVVVSCASRGRMRGTEELLELRPDSELPKSVLRPLLAAQDADVDRRSAALLALTTFVGLPSDVTSLAPLTLHPVIPQLAELPDPFYARQSLEFDGPDLLRLIDHASPAAQRASAEWIALWTLRKVGLEHDPRAVAVTAQFGQGRPATLGPALGLVLEVHQRAARLRATDPSRYGGHPRADTRASWMQEWALFALRYTTLEDPRSAALGAVDCLRHFMLEPATPDAEGRYPFPDLSAEVTAAADLVRPLLTGVAGEPNARE